VAVIGTRSGEIPGVLGDAGVLVPPGDVRALTDAIVMLVEGSDLRAVLGERGRARVLGRYTNDRIASDTAAFYRSIVHRPS
jgi:glycosyltransferase involved in cell wall biosynthesis